MSAGATLFAFLGLFFPQNKMSLSSREIGKALGVSHVAVNKAALRGRIPREADGGFDLAKVKAVWVVNADQHQRARGLKALAPKVAPVPAAKPKRHEKRKPETAETPREAVDADIDPLSEDGSFLEAQRQSAWIKVQRERLQLDERSGALVDAREAAEVSETRASSEKEALLNWPARVAVEIAAQLGADERTVHQILDAQVRIFLSERCSLRV